MDDCTVMVVFKVIILLPAGSGAGALENARIVL